MMDADEALRLSELAQAQLKDDNYQRNEDKIKEILQLIGQTALTTGKTHLEYDCVTQDRAYYIADYLIKNKNYRVKVVNGRVLFINWGREG